MNNPAILACGAWLKNRACLVQGGAVTWSALHGDLGDPDNCLALENSLSDLLAQAGGAVDAIAHDLHPDFYSSRLARELAARLGVPAIPVQHHHAHIAALMAEHGVDEPVIGLALDGVGLGTDGVAWGGELLWVGHGSWRRCGHLGQLALPGGDAAAREPWRMAAAVLFALGRGAEIEARLAPAVGAQATSIVHAMLRQSLNCPATTSAGRWFDAAAGALGICPKQDAEAQAAIALEQLGQAYIDRHGAPAALVYSYVDEAGNLDLQPLLAHMFDLADAGQAGQGAALFHVTLASALAQWAVLAAQEHGVLQVALGGGCFMNRILASCLVSRLEQAGLRVLQVRAVPCGDAGIALGQAWVARGQLVLPTQHATQEVACA